MVEMMMLRWRGGHIKVDRLRNDNISQQVEATPIEDN